MWNSIASLETIIKEPWLLMGDFNAIRYGNEPKTSTIAWTPLLFWSFI